MSTTEKALSATLETSEKKHQVEKATIHDKAHMIRCIRWMTGSNGKYTLPGLEHTNLTLIPTGELLKQGIAPLGGAQDEGVDAMGTNQTTLSGACPNYKNSALPSFAGFDEAFRYSKTDNIGVFSKETLSQSLQISVQEKIKNLIKSCKPEGCLAPKFKNRWDQNALMSLAIDMLKLRQLDDALYQTCAKEAQELLGYVKTKSAWECASEIENVRAVLDLELPMDQLKDQHGNLDWETAIPKFLSRYNSKPCWDLKYIRQYGAKHDDNIWPHKNNIAQRAHCISHADLVAAIVYVKMVNGRLEKHAYDFVDNYLKEATLAIERAVNYYDNIVNKGPKFQWTEADIAWMTNRKNPLSLVFCLTSPAVETTSPRGLICWSDVNVPLTLGKEIGLIITNEEGQKDILAFLGKHQLSDKVYVCTDTEYRAIVRQEQAAASKIQGCFRQFLAHKRKKATLIEAASEPLASSEHATAAPC